MHAREVASLRGSMGIERVIAPPYPRHALRGMVSVGSQEVVDTVRLAHKLTAADL